MISPVYILVGHPNAGKTTLFNYLTASSQRVVNYPGSTTVWSKAMIPQSEVVVVDTPGMDTLEPNSDDQQVTLSLIQSPRSMGMDAPIRLVWVVDATQLSRQLALIALLNQPLSGGVLVITRSKQVSISDGMLHRLTTEWGLRVYLDDDRGLRALSRDMMQGVGTAYYGVQLEPPSDEQIMGAFAKSEDLAMGLVTPLQSSRLDAWVLHPIWGALLMAMVLSMGFWLTFLLSQPLVEWIESGWLTVAQLIGRLIVNPVMRSVVVDGVLGSIGSVLVFLPSLLLLFAWFSCLDQSGFLARLTVRLDRILGYFGMEGRSAVPILSGYGCAIPAILACRSIPHSKERVLTILAIPLATCMARLPVYALVLTMLTESSVIRGMGLSGIYMMSLVLVLGAAKLAARWVPDTPSVSSGFAMTLPQWQWPNWLLVCQYAMSQTLHFIKKAGIAIILIGVGLWIAGQYPHPDRSLLLMTSHWLNPIMNLMGADWRIGLGILASFGARELFVPALYSVSPDGLYVSNLTAIAIIVFYMIALQCGATVAVLQQELKSARWAWGLTVGYTVVGLALSIVGYQFIRWVQGICC